MEIEKILQDVQENPLFQRLKNVVEHGFEGDKVWHDKEPVFDHSVKTLRIAKERLSGDFITDPKAKELFQNWLNQDVRGMQQKDASLLIALIHDCGKVLHYKEGNKETTLISPKPGSNKDEYMCPGHEYWGSKIVVPELLKGVAMSEDAKKYVQQIVEYHGLYSNPYFPSKKDWSLQEVMDNVKAFYCGYYIEGLFNMFCDGYTATAFAEGKKRIEQLFNKPLFYTPREYFIPEK